MERAVDTVRLGEARAKEELVEDTEVEVEVDRSGEAVGPLAAVEAAGKVVSRMTIRPSHLTNLPTSMETTTLGQLSLGGLQC